MWVLIIKLLPGSVTLSLKTVFVHSFFHPSSVKHPVSKFFLFTVAKHLLIVSSDDTSIYGSKADNNWMHAFAL